MDPKILTENAWKTHVIKFKIKDNGLQKALASYEDIDDDAHDDLLKGIADISRLASVQRKSKDIAANPPLAKFLDDLLKAADAEQKDVAKDKAQADKNAAAQKQKTAAQPQTNDADDDDEEEDEEEYATLLESSLKKLRSSKDLAYEFLVCEAKPQYGVMVARKITTKHKALLTELTGSKHFLPVGSCQFLEGKFVFNVEKPTAGLAKKIQQSIKSFTGKNFPVKVGDESAEDDDDAKAAVALDVPKLPQPELAKAPEVWRGTRALLQNNLKALKDAVRKKLGGESDDSVETINGNLDKLDSIIIKLDTRLSDSLAAAVENKDAESRKAALQKSKAILADYINYVKSEPLIAFVDANPFGVKTNLKVTLAGSLTHMAQSIGKV